MTESRKEKLAGALVSLPTFTDNYLNLDVTKQRKHIRWLLDQGIVGDAGVIMVAGGYGEGYYLNDSELFTLIDVLMDEAGGKIPTMVGIFDLNVRKVARRAKYAADAGIDFLELGLPHYSCPSEDDVFIFTKYINDNVDIGIMNYNNFWATPPPGFEITRNLMERMTELENVVGFKWSSANMAHYVGMLRLFKDEFAFMDNAMTNSLGTRHGMKGFVDFYGNVAPRLSLKKLELINEKKYDELDDLLYRVHFDAENTLNKADSPAFSSVADGVYGRLRWRLMGLETGLNFPAQAQPSPEYIDHTKKVIEASHMMEWVDWDQSILDQ